MIEAPQMVVQCPAMLNPLFNERRDYLGLGSTSILCRFLVNFRFPFFDFGVSFSNVSTIWKFTCRCSTQTLCTTTVSEMNVSIAGLILELEIISRTGMLRIHIGFKDNPAQKKLGKWNQINCFKKWMSPNSGEGHCRGCTVKHSDFGPFQCKLPDPIFALHVRHEAKW